MIPAVPFLPKSFDRTEFEFCVPHQQNRGNIRYSCPLLNCRRNTKSFPDLLPSLSDLEKHIKDDHTSDLGDRALETVLPIQITHPDFDINGDNRDDLLRFIRTIDAHINAAFAEK